MPIAFRPPLALTYSPTKQEKPPVIEEPHIAVNIPDEQSEESSVDELDQGFAWYNPLRYVGNWLFPMPEDDELDDQNTIYEQNTY